MPRPTQTTIPPLTSQALAITALAGGGRTGSPVLSAGYNEIGTVATLNDSAQLPPALYGLEIFVKNAGANAAFVFANGSDTINGTAGATGVAQAAGVGALYVCHKDGVWTRFVQG